MNDVATHLRSHYYSKYEKCHYVPSETDLLKALTIHQSKVITVYKGQEIAGVAIYLTLDDASYEHIESFDIGRIDVLSRLLLQTGKNFHFILVTADSYETIKTGIRIVKALKPKSISWWNPNMTHLHKYGGK